MSIKNELLILKFWKRSDDCNRGIVLQLQKIKLDYLAYSFYKYGETTDYKTYFYVH